MVSEFITITTVGLLGIISPGPDFAMVVKSSLSYGRRNGILTALGITVANIIQVIINIIGIGVLIKQSPIAFQSIKIIGAIYLIYLGLQGFINKSNAQPTLPKQSGFMAGFITSLFNPKAILFYLSLFSAVFTAKHSWLIKFSYGLWIAAMALIWFSIVATLFTHAKWNKTIYKIKPWLERITGLILLVLGGKILLN